MLIYIVYSCIENADEELTTMSHLKKLRRILITLLLSRKIQRLSSWRVWTIKWKLKIRLSPKRWSYSKIKSILKRKNGRHSKKSCENTQERLSSRIFNNYHDGVSNMVHISLFSCISHK